MKLSNTNSKYDLPETMATSFKHFKYLWGGGFKAPVVREDPGYINTQSSDIKQFTPFELFPYEMSGTNSEHCALAMFYSSVLCSAQNTVVVTLVGIVHFDGER